MGGAAAVGLLGTKTGRKALRKGAAAVSRRTGIAQAWQGRKEGLKQKEKKRFSGIRAAAKRRYSETRSDRKAAREAKAYEITGATKADRANHINRSSALTPDKLKNASVGAAFNEQQRRQIIHNEGVDRSRRVTLAGNTEAVRRMSASERNNIETLEVNANIDLPTSGPGVTPAAAAANRAQNRKNKVENEVHKAVQRAYYQAVSQLKSEGEKSATT